MKQETAGYMQRAQDTVKANLGALGLPVGAKVFADGILIDEGKFAHPVVVVELGPSKPILRYAMGGKDLGQIYPVTGDENFITVRWTPDITRSYRGIKDEKGVKEMSFDSKAGLLGVRLGENALESDVLLGKDEVGRLTSQEVPGGTVNWKVRRMEELVKAFKAAAGNQGEKTAEVKS